jgi:molecular chaperone HtpG
MFDHTGDSMEQQYNFEADMTQLLDIVANALYSNRDVFLRELVSNAADACDKKRYLSASGKITGSDTPLKIHVDANPELKIITVQDNGIGMNEQELLENLGTIARSGTRILSAQMQSNDENFPSLIGQFGVGFYASFMVAERVRVISRPALSPSECWFWESTGQQQFTMRPASAEESALLNDQSGTHITLYTKENAEEYLNYNKLQGILKTYSDHISFPITLLDADQPAINAGGALWTRSKSDITTQEYTEFYHHINHGFDDPLRTLHWKAEGAIEYTALLYTPSMRPFDLYDPKREHALRLYVKRIFITDHCAGLLPSWLRFVRGVVDSADLPLNISREMLQDNPLIYKIGQGIIKKILNDYSDFAKNDPDGYHTFWGQFGAVLKEGLYDSVAETQKNILNLCRFFCTNATDTAVSLQDYIQTMPEAQDKIYYLTGESADSLKHSPHLEGFKARGIAVLLMTDTIDSFWLQSVKSYEDKEFQSITKGDIDLSAFPLLNPTDETAQTDDSKRSDDLLGKIKKLLNDQVQDVRYSNRLIGTPACLVASDAGIDMHMERYLKIQQKFDSGQKRVLEINPQHDIIKKMDTTNDPALLEDLAIILYGQALIALNEPVPNSSDFIKRMNRYL